MAAESDIDLVLGTNLQGFVAGLGEATSKLSSALESMRVVAKKETNEIDAAFQTLGVRSLASVEAEIKDVERAFDTLKRSGTLSAQEIAVAQNKAQIQIAQLRSETTGWADAFDQVKGKALVAVASLAGVATVLGSAGAAAAEFGREMAAVSTQLDDPSGLPQLSEDVRELSRELGGSAPENAKALYEILSAGVSDPIAAMDRLTVANKLAIGGVTDLGTATTGLNSLMAAYGDAAGNAANVSDALFVAAKAGRTSIGDLASSIGTVAPIAAQAGVSMDELLANVAALSNVVGNSAAVTQFTSVLTGVIKPTGEAAKLAKELGLEFNVAALEAKGMAGFLADVQEKTGGSAEAMAVLFGRIEGTSGALTLIGPQAESAARGLEQMADKAGKSEQAFKTLSETDAFKLQKFSQAVNDLQLSLGKAVIALTPLVSLLTGALNTFSDLPEPIKLVTLGIGALVAALVPLGFAFTALKAPVALLAATALPQLTAAFAASAAAAVASAGGAAALLLRFGPLGIAAGALALATSAAADSLTEYALAQQQVAAEGEYAELLRKEIVERQAAADALKNYADVAVLSAEQLKTLTADEIAAYKERIEGAKEYESNITGVIVRQKELGDSTAANTEAARLNAERQKELNAGLEALAAAIAKAAEKAPTLLQKLIELIYGFQETGKASDSTALAFEKLFKDTDWSKSEEVDKLAKGLGRVAEYANLADQDLRNGLTESLKELSGAQLLALAESSREAFKVGTSGAGALRDALKTLGIIDVNAEFDASVATLRKLQQAYTTAFESGSDGATEAFVAVQRAGSEVARLRKELDTTKVSAEELSGAFKEIGVKSQKDLIAEAERARKAFELITQAVKDGGAAQADVARAFEAYAARLRETAEDADEATRRQIAQQIELAGSVAGVSKELIATATAALTAGDTLKRAGDVAKTSFDGAAKSLGAVAESIDETAKSVGKTADSVRDITSAVDKSTQAWIDNENALSGAAEQNKITSAVMGQTLGVIEDGIYKINVQAGRRAELDRDAFERLNPEYQQRRFLLSQQESANKAVAEQIRLLESQNPELAKETQQRQALTDKYKHATEGLDRLLQLQREQNEVRNDGLQIGQQELAQIESAATSGPNAIIRRIEFELRVTNAQTGGAQPLQLTDTQIREIADRVITVIQRDQNA